MRKFLSILLLSLFFSGNAYTEIIKLEKCITIHGRLIGEYATYYKIDLYENDNREKIKNKKWSKEFYDFSNTSWFDEKLGFFTGPDGSRWDIETESFVLSDFPLTTTQVADEFSYTINTENNSIIWYKEYTDQFINFWNKSDYNNTKANNKKLSQNRRSENLDKFSTDIIKLTGEAGDRFFGEVESRYEYMIDTKKNIILRKDINTKSSDNTRKIVCQTN